MRPAGRSSKKHFATLMSAACGLALAASADAAVQPLSVNGNKILAGGNKPASRVIASSGAITAGAAKNITPLAQWRG